MEEFKPTAFLGQTLDERYKITEVVGAGGMAFVFRAEDLWNHNTSVAVKILKREYGEKKDYVSRFKTESRVLTKLDHPNIVKIVDLEIREDKEIKYIVTEFIEGVTLSDELEEQGSFKISDAANFVIQTLFALSAAHDKGVVHQDVKLQNIMLLDDKKTIKLMDFGIALFCLETDINLSGKPIGSVYYICPEQARGQKTDERSDIYSVGITLFEMLTGARPFTAESNRGVAVMQITATPPKITDKNPSLPVGISEIVSKALRKNPDERYQTAISMIGDLKAFLANPEITFGYEDLALRTEELEEPSTAIMKEELKKMALNKKIDSHTVNTGESIFNSDKFRPVYEDESEFESENYSPKPPAPTNSYPEYDDELDDYDDEVALRRSPIIPILAAIASVFVITTTILIYLVANDKIGGFINDKTVTVPQVFFSNSVGLLYTELEKSFPGYTFKIVGREFSDTVPENAIIRQDPLPNEQIKQTQIIDIIISNGAEKATVPNVSGLPYDNAIQQLNGAGFTKIKKITRSDETVKSGHVIGTEPAAGELIAASAEITVRVSMGSGETGDFAAPDLIGKTPAEADTLLKPLEVSLDINEIEVTDTSKIGKIIEQTPAEGTPIRALSRISIVVGKGKSNARRITVTRQIGSEVTGAYLIRYYADGVQKKSYTLDIDATQNRRIEWEIEGTDAAVYEIIVESLTTNNKGTLYKAVIDFGTEPPSEKIMTDNYNVFTEINTVETDPPVTVTDPPASSEEETHNVENSVY